MTQTPFLTIVGACQQLPKTYKTTIDSSLKKWIVHTDSPNLSGKPAFRLGFSLHQLDSCETKIWEQCQTQCLPVSTLGIGLGVLLIRTQNNVGIPIFTFYVQGKPFKRGFFCDDESLRYPYRESTVENWLLYSYVLALPLTIIIVTEYILKAYTRETTANFIWETYGNVLVFLFGAGCTQLLTDIGKYTIGRLRPHFFAVCAPNVDCNDPRMRNVYIENFQCRGRDAHLLKDMRLSFPSGHSSISAYSMVFISMYCSAKLVGSGSRWVKRVIQYFAIVLAFYTGLSRVSDYKHHWSDVLAGLALGTLTAVLIVLFASDLFSRTKMDAERKTVSSPGESIPLAETPEEPERTFTVI